MLKIRPIEEKDLFRIQEFTDQEIGTGYYSLEEVKEIYKKSSKNGAISSFLLEDPQGKIQGIRLSYPPGNWTHGKGQGLNPQLWPHPLEDTAYFQSLFVSDAYQGQGWGAQLSQESLKVLAQMGAKGIVCHSWKESPNNSSEKYLLKLGFKTLWEHPHYWRDVPYNCTRCKKPPCLCTALEMYLDLDKTFKKG